MEWFVCLLNGKRAKITNPFQNTEPHRILVSLLGTSYKPVTKQSQLYSHGSFQPGLDTTTKGSTSPLIIHPSHSLP